MHRKQLGFILVVTSVLLFIMVLLVLYQPHDLFSADATKITAEQMTPSLIFSIILVLFILVYGILLLTHKFRYYML